MESTGADFRQLYFGGCGPGPGRVGDDDCRFGGGQSGPGVPGPGPPSGRAAMKKPGGQAPSRFFCGICFGTMFSLFDVSKIPLENI